MLHLLDESLEAFLRAAIPAPAGDIDISFERPDGTWGAGVTRPTLNLHLWEIKPAGEEAQAGYAIQNVNGTLVRKAWLPRVHLRYLVTAWTSETKDQHQLLGSVLAAILMTRTFPAKYLPPAIAALHPPPTLKLANTEPSRTAEFWSASQGDLRASLDVLLSVSLDAATMLQLAPPPTGVVVGVRDQEDPHRSSRRESVRGIAPPTLAGSVVRSPRGSGVVGPDGSWAVPAGPGDTIVIDGPDGTVRAEPAGDGDQPTAGEQPAAVGAGSGAPAPKARGRRASP